jgi:hypothetical protein
MLRITAFLLDSKINQKSSDSTDFNKYGVLKKFWNRESKFFSRRPHVTANEL